MKKFFALALLSALSAIGLGCGSSGSSQNLNSQPGNVFMTGEDAPLPSVVGFNVTLNSVMLNAQDGSTATVISSPTTVDFARLVGLRSPLAFSSVKANTYVSATFVLANPSITWVDMTQNPPAIGAAITATFPGNQNPYSVTVNFPSPMVVGSNGLAGLKMEMDIRQSVAVDGNGQVTGAVNPVIYIKATKASDPDGQITDLTAGLVSVDSASNSFVLQGPYGRQLTVFVNNNTTFNSGYNINNLATPAIVGVQGYFQADGSLMASGVEVITTTQSFVSGRVLQVVNNGAGQAQQVTMWIGESGADLVADVDTVQTIDLSLVNSNSYAICFFDNGFTQLLFNNTSILVGQRIFIGGTVVSNTFTPTMVSLRLQGVYGLFNPGSVTVSNGNAGNFQLMNNALIGYSLGGADLTVNTFNGTLFVDLSGLNQLQATSTQIPLITRGLLLKDPISGNAQFYAGLVADPPITVTH